MPSPVAEAFAITLLSKLHKRSSFFCGVPSLDQYFHQQAGQDLRKKVAATYVLQDKECGRVVGYYTLSSTIIELKSLPDAAVKKLPGYPYVPATLIGRLAIDKNYQERGFGALMLVDALKRSYQASLEVASFAVVVDAIDPAATSFYKKYGFINLVSSGMRLFLPMQVIAAL